LRTIGSPGQHHVDHPSRADQAWNAHGTTPTDEYPAHALRQSVVRAVFGHSDMCSSGQLQTAADDRTVQNRDNRYLTILDRVASTVRRPRKSYRVCGAGVRDGGKIGASRKMVSLSMQDDGTCSFRQGIEERAEAYNHLIIQRIALGRTRQSHQSHRPA